MSYHFAFKLKSRNAKTGDMPVTTNDARTCPDACPLKASGACYAKHGPLGMYWQKLNKGQYASTWANLIDNVAKLTANTIWRYGQAGDLPGENNHIDPVAMRQLIAANMGKRGYTYTHKPVETDANNAALVAEANRNGFTVNLSADNLNEADDLKALNIGPVVTVLPREAPAVSYTPHGHKVIVCPAQTRDDVTCKSCGLCAVSTRDVIVGFLAHGVSAKKAEAIALA